MDKITEGDITIDEQEEMTNVDKTKVKESLESIKKSYLNVKNATGDSDAKKALSVFKKEQSSATNLLDGLRSKTVSQIQAIHKDIQKLPALSETPTQIEIAKVEDILKKEKILRDNYSEITKTQLKFYKEQEKIFNNLVTLSNTDIDKDIIDDFKKVADVDANFAKNIKSEMGTISTNIENIVKNAKNKGSIPDHALMRYGKSVMTWVKSNKLLASLIGGMAALVAVAGTIYAVSSSEPDYQSEDLYKELGL